MNEWMNKLYFTRVVEKTRGLFISSPRPWRKPLYKYNELQYILSTSTYIQRKRGGDRDRQTDRDRERQRETQRYTQRHRERERHRQTDRQTDRHRQTETQTDRQTDRDTDTQRDTERDGDRQTDRQTDRDRDREKTTKYFFSNWKKQQTKKRKACSIQDSIGAN